MQQDGPLGNMCPVRPLQVNDFLKERKGHVWYQYGISLAYHSLVGPFQFGTTGRNKLNTPTLSMVNSGSNCIKKDLIR